MEMKNLQFNLGGIRNSLQLQDWITMHSITSLLVICQICIQNKSFSG